MFVRISFNEDRVPLGGDPSRFVATFAGTHGIAQGLDSILDAAALVGSNENITFAFIGDGPLRSALVDDAAQRGLTNVLFSPQVPLDQMPALLAASDALLVTLSSHQTFKTFVPSKLMDFMAVGRPVILSAAGESARILDEAGGGIAVPPEDPGALLNAVRWLRDNPAEAASMAVRGRAFARTQLRSVHARQLEELLLEVASARA